MEGGSRTADLVFGSFPGDAQPLERLAERLVAQVDRTQALVETHLGQAVERPQASRLAEGTRAALEQPGNLLGLGRCEERSRVFGPGRPFL